MFCNIRNTNFCIWIINIISIATTFTYSNTKRINYRIITININNLWSCFTFLIFIEIQFNEEFAFAKFDKIVSPMKNIFLKNLNILIYIMLFLLLNIYECL